MRPRGWPSAPASSRAPALARGLRGKCRTTVQGTRPPAARYSAAAALETAIARCSSHSAEAGSSQPEAALCSTGTVSAPPERSARRCAAESRWQHTTGVPPALFSAAACAPNCASPVSMSRPCRRTSSIPAGTGHSGAVSRRTAIRTMCLRAERAAQSSTIRSAPPSARLATAACRRGAVCSNSGGCSANIAGASMRASASMKRGVSMPGSGSAGVSGPASQFACAPESFTTLPQRAISLFT